MKVCIFCEKKDKKHNGRKQPLVNAETKNFEKKKKEYASDSVLCLCIVPMKDNFIIYLIFLVQ